MSWLRRLARRSAEHSSGVSTAMRIPGAPCSGAPCSRAVKISPTVSASPMTLTGRRIRNTRSIRRTNSVRPRLSIPRSRSSLLDKVTFKEEALEPWSSRTRPVTTATSVSARDVASAAFWSTPTFIIYDSRRLAVHFDKDQGPSVAVGGSRTRSRRIAWEDSAMGAEGKGRIDRCPGGASKRRFGPVWEAR